ncbi:hypothetical protein [Mangrovicella endophytica]|uniref:hypothetical protein n=1 Tax=Mangrovicella endophytica TaxID=2066697 RepID=UPI0012FFDDED|nr:hypothetical protein [Mangrovicella endophytica]
MSERFGTRVSPGIAALLATLLAAPAAAAWTGKTGEASASVEGGGRLRFACAAGALRMTLSAPGWRFADGEAYTVVADIDGTAFMLPAKARQDPQTGVAVIARDAAPADYAPLIAALKAGRRLVISGPGGRWTLKLTGSGAALRQLEAGC